MMLFDKSMLFFIKAALIGFASILAIPREVYKKYLIYGFVFGFVPDIVVVYFLKSLNLAEYLNMGPFSINNLVSFWTPFSWMFAMAIFLYVLPVRKKFFYPYIIGAGYAAWSMGIMLENLGLFYYIGAYRYISPLVFTAWFGIVAWAYLKSESIELK